MDWSIREPWWLLLALLAVPLGLIAWRAFGSMSVPRRWSAVFARSLLLLLLGVMLAGVARVRETDRLAVVAVVDVSGSIRRFGDADTPDRVRAWLDGAARNRTPDDLFGVVVFDGRSLTIATPTSADIGDRALDLRLAEGTDIGAALRAASALVPPDAAGRLVLLSDGVQTRGDALASAAELGAAAGAPRPVDVVPVRYAARAETMIERLDTPPTANAEATVPVRVLVRSTSGAEGTLRLSLAGEPVDLDPGAPGTGRRVRLAPGRDVITAEVTLPPGRIHAFEAVFEPDPSPGVPPGAVAGDAEGAPFSGDTALDNNRAEAFTITPGAGRILLVRQEGADRAPSRLAQTLTGAGFDVEVTVGAGVPRDLLAMQDFDCVILDNVPAEDLAPRTHDALAAYVQDTGGGLIMAGGPDSFGAGGWLGTDLEPVLPVLLDLPDQLIVPEAAVVFVLDSSGSMSASVLGSSRSQQQIANESAALAVGALDERDEVAVISFNSVTTVVHELAPNDDPGSVAESIKAIASGGGTDLAPALLEAGAQLADSEARLKHIIVLSDGRSQDAEVLPGLAQELHGRGIKLTAIAIGDQSDATTMQAIADAGEGAFYNVFNPNLLPRVFLKAVRVVRSPLVREGAFTPVVTDPAASLLYGVDRPAELGGLVLTRTRAEANAVNVLLTEEGEPVLATWQTELGRAAAFTADTDRWSRPWVREGLYASFWPALVRSIARPDSSRSGELRVTPGDDTIRVSFDAADPDGRPLDHLTVPATVYTPDGRAEEVLLAQAGPGRYEARVPVAGSGNHIVVVRPRQGTKALAPVIGGVATRLGAEYRRLRSDDALLEQLARQTGGRVLDLDTPPVDRGPGGLWDRAGIPPARARTPLWPLLLSFSIAVLLMDIGTRRIAWDRLLEDGADRTVRRPAPDGAAAADLRSTTEALRSRTRDDLALGDDDAERIVREQHQRRLRGRFSAPGTPAPDPEPQARTEPPAVPKASKQTGAPDGGAGPKTPTSEPAARAKIERKSAGDTPRDDAGTESAQRGLLAAKRRARERFDDTGGR